MQNIIKVFSYGVETQKSTVHHVEIVVEDRERIDVPYLHTGKYDVTVVVVE